MAAPPRLQTMMLAVQEYNLKVKYIPGKKVGLADVINRLPNPDNKEEVRMDVRIEHIQFSEHKIKSIKESIQDNPITS